MGATMGFVGGLLKFHGLLESAAGIAMIVVTEMVFPFLAGQSLEVQYVGKMFGAAILALGLTALMSNVSSGILFGAFAYHSTVTSLLCVNFSKILSAIRIKLLWLAVYMVFLRFYLHSLGQLIPHRKLKRNNKLFALA